MLCSSALCHPHLNNSPEPQQNNPFLSEPLGDGKGEKRAFNSVQPQCKGQFVPPELAVLGEGLRSIQALWEPPWPVCLWLQRQRGRAAPAALGFPAPFLAPPAAEAFPKRTETLE